MHILYETRFFFKYFILILFLFGKNLLFLFIYLIKKTRKKFTSVANTNKNVSIQAADFERAVVSVCMAAIFYSGSV